MRHFRYIFLILFIVGCGVMSSPKDENRGDENSYADDADVAGALKSSIFSRVLLKRFSDLNAELLTYKIITNSSELNSLVSDLNLSNKDNQTLISCDLNNFFLLYFPIKRSSDCGYVDDVVSDLNVTTITIKSNLKDCKDSITYYLPFYQIEKTIKKIEIKAYKDESVSIEL